MQHQNMYQCASSLVMTEIMMPYASQHALCTPKKQHVSCLLLFKQCPAEDGDATGCTAPA
jgi:hypothetical protein